jgi:hypothetical protein
MQYIFKMKHLNAALCLQIYSFIVAVLVLLGVFRFSECLRYEQNKQTNKLRGP